MQSIPCRPVSLGSHECTGRVVARKGSDYDCYRRLWGIDRGIVRLVCHYSLPKSIEAFYQESGRAGRDQQPCRSIVYYGVQDRRIMEFIIKKDDGSRGKGTASPQRVKNGLDAFQKMVDYCELLSCRRIKLLTHFGEAATPRLCAGGCDVCKAPHAVQAALQELRESGAVGGSGAFPRVQMGRPPLSTKLKQLVESEFWKRDDEEEPEESISGSDGEDEATEKIVRVERRVGKRATFDRKMEAMSRAEEAYKRERAAPTSRLASLRQQFKPPRLASGVSSPRAAFTTARAVMGSSIANRTLKRPTAAQTSTSNNPDPADPPRHKARLQIPTVPLSQDPWQ
ncbi:hypothetical protein CLOP_g3462 [Closterium sp. NIES-67]|nr:hypothetical protein CLOP_g3462 [Closterium sp. NIES-67]